jgi:hypothetical protein
MNIKINAYERMQLLMLTGLSLNVLLLGFMLGTIEVA